MRAGSLNRVVLLLRRGAAVDDGYAAVPGAWQLLGTRRASVKPVQVRESSEGDGRVAQRRLSVWLRWDSLARSLVATDAVAIDGRVHELVAEPVEVGFRDGIELIATAADPAVTVEASALAAWTAP